MLQDNSSTHKSFITKSILDERDEMIKKFISLWMNEKDALEKITLMQKEKYRDK